MQPYPTLPYPTLPYLPSSMPTILVNHAALPSMPIILVNHAALPYPTLPSILHAYNTSKPCCPILPNPTPCLQHHKWTMPYPTPILQYKCIPMPGCLGFWFLEKLGQPPKIFISYSLSVAQLQGAITLKSLTIISSFMLSVLSAKALLIFLSHPFKKGLAIS